ncbi:hypothetical protein B0H34DRAFT_798097 [Crassisporium funariophilum]|nr:hypothetical protein B0H34DRAFT_798097 [Crassisporium funariophilum]
MGSVPTHAKHEPDASDTPVKMERNASPVPPAISVKAEPSEQSISSTSSVSVHNDKGDSMPVELELPQADMDAGMSSDTAVNKWDLSDHDSDFGGIHSSNYAMSKASSDESMSDCKGQPSEMDTVWLDSDVNRQLRIEAAEYLTALPSYWPIPRDKCAYFIDLSDPKYKIQDDEGDLLLVDALIKDRDCWQGGTGKGNSTSTIKFTEGGPKIECRRSCLDCAGFYACDHVKEDTYSVERYELDSQALLDLVGAQIEARLDKGNTPEKQALV